MSGLRAVPHVMVRPLSGIDVSAGGLWRSAGVVAVPGEFEVQGSLEFDRSNSQADSAGSIPVTRFRVKAIAPCAPIQAINQAMAMNWQTAAAQT